MITDEKKKELFPFFALAYSQQLDPEKYGAVESYEEWAGLLEKSPEDVEKITAAASQLTDEQWGQIELDYKSETESADVPTAKKGVKIDHLKKLQSYKKGKRLTKAKKCACGCDMISKKMKGGKMVLKCSCGCKGKK